MRRSYDGELDFNCSTLTFLKPARSSLQKPKCSFDHAHWNIAVTGSAGRPIKLEAACVMCCAISICGLQGDRGLFF